MRLAKVCAATRRFFGPGLWREFYQPATADGNRTLLELNRIRSGIAAHVCNGPPGWCAVPHAPEFPPTRRKVPPDVSARWQDPRPRAETASFHPSKRQMDRYLSGS